jgi:hypothetical protein
MVEQVVATLFSNFLQNIVKGNPMS